MTTAVPARPTSSSARPPQPWRVLAALVEVLLAAVGVAVGVWCWHHGVAMIVTPTGPGQPPLVSTVLYGDWAAAAIGLCALAALLAVEAARQAVRAGRSRAWRR